MAGLFDSIQLRAIQLKNRIVMPPMANSMSGERGEVTDAHLRHYSARAQAGVGLVIVEYAYVTRNGRESNRQLGIYEDSLIPGLRRLAEAIKSKGAVAAIQITHAGSWAPRDVISDWPVSPSGVRIPGDTGPSRPLTDLEIRQMVTAFEDAARRAMEAGFDIVEIHGAHGYLLNQFASPYTNHRDDEYGGNMANRLHFPLQVVRQVAGQLADGSPLFYRLGADDFTPGGLTAEDGQKIARELVKAGVDVIDVSGGLIGSGRDRFSEQGYFVPLAAKIREAAGVPVIGVGNITEPEFADRVIWEGKVDLVAIGRALLSDPQWAVKAAQRLGVGS